MARRRPEIPLAKIWYFQTYLLQFFCTFVLWFFFQKIVTVLFYFLKEAEKKKDDSHFFSRQEKKRTEKKKKKFTFKKLDSVFISYSVISFNCSFYLFNCSSSFWWYKSHNLRIFCYLLHYFIDFNENFEKQKYTQEVFAERNTSFVSYSFLYNSKTSLSISDFICWLILS